MKWESDEEFDYIDIDNTKYTVSWNLDEDDTVFITLVEWDDIEHRHFTGDELYDMSIELAEDIVSYIEDEFLESEDFWLTKMGYDF
jgi:hypothetical protein|tara:strand:- start:212 stop:469 length:258 start_codon:yes stop_codon:yes gene_type:complete